MATTPLPSNTMAKTWLITGCTSGLGREMARQALERGDNVVLTARRIGDLADLAERHREQALVQALDVTQPTQSHAAIAAAIERFGRLDVLVNNAGYGLMGAVEEVQELLSFYDVEASRLKLEITETMLVDRIDEIIAKINELRAIGVRFSLDDFGTGYSSLSYLKRLPFDQVKIDQSFARGALENANDAAICRAIIALGHALKLDVVAEGIETEAQWAFFKGEGCHYGQGYFFGRPVPHDEFIERHAGVVDA